MSLYDKYGDEFDSLIIRSLSVCPNNKKSVLRFDNMPQRSGYLQYHLAKEMDYVTFDTFDTFHRKKKSNLMLHEDEIVHNYNHEETIMKKQYLKDLHNEGQQLLSNLIPDTYKLIKFNPGLYQSQLVELSGFTKDKMNDNNFAFVTIFDIMKSQNIIDDCKENNHRYFGCIENKPYKPFEYFEPQKNMSKYEAQFADYLKRKNINFEQQVRIPECKNKKALPFDFVVYIDDMEIFVEIDGQQHYEFNKHFHGTQDGFAKMKKRDQIKNNFAKEQELLFFRIRYDEDIVETFEKKLKALGIKIN